MSFFKNLWRKSLNVKRSQQYSIEDYNTPKLMELPEEVRQFLLEIKIYPDEADAYFFILIRLLYVHFKRESYGRFLKELSQRYESNDMASMSIVLLSSSPPNSPETLPIVTADDVNGVNFSLTVSAASSSSSSSIPASASTSTSNSHQRQQTQQDQSTTSSLLIPPSSVANNRTNSTSSGSTSPPSSPPLNSLLDVTSTNNVIDITMGQSSDSSTTATATATATAVAAADVASTNSKSASKKKSHAMKHSRVQRTRSVAFQPPSEEQLIRLQNSIAASSLSRPSNSSSTNASIASVSSTITASQTDSQVSVSPSNHDASEELSSVPQSPITVVSDTANISKSSKRQLVDEVKHMIILEDPRPLFRKMQPIGEGKYGSVYTALDTNGRRVALKGMKTNIEKNLTQIYNEIRMLASSKHPNIVSYYGAYQHNNRVWLVMEFLDLQSLAVALPPKCLQEKQLAYVIQSVLRSLQFLHNNNRIHRDIKGDNILLSMAGEVKLADFGLCIQATDGSYTGVAGSRLYMAPEMVLCQSYNCSVDIWSLGCLIFELVQGEPPYSQYHYVKAWFRTITRGPDTLNTKSADLRDFVSQCFKMNPDDRATATQLLKHPFLQGAICQKTMAKVIKDLVEKEEASSVF